MAPATRASAGFSPRPYVVAGYLTVALVFGGFGGWAVLMPLNSGIVAPGTVAIETDRKTVQHLEGGIILEILVKDGQTVEKGDALLKLDPTQASGNYLYYRNRLVPLIAAHARLAAESAEATEIAFPDELSPSSEPVVESAMALQEAIFRDRKATRDGQVAILDSRVQQLKDAVDGLDQQRSSVGKEIASLGEEITRLDKGQANGVVAVNQMAATMRAELDMQGKVSRIVSDTSRLQQTIAESKLQVVQIHQQFVERASGELRDNDDQLNEMQERVRVAKDILDRSILRAPVAGMLQNIRIHTKGGVIRPAEPIMDIVPLHENLVVLARVRPIDIDNVAVGMGAEVRFSSFSQQTTPRMSGHIVVLSRDVVAPTQQNEQPYYAARIEVARSDMPREIASEMMPGLPVDVIISTGERSFAEYVAKPFLESFHQRAARN